MSRDGDCTRKPSKYAAAGRHQHWMRFGAFLIVETMTFNSLCGQPSEGPTSQAPTGISCYPPNMPQSKSEEYKKTDGGELGLYFFMPKNHSAHDRRPAIIFFFGGGFKSGSPQQFEKPCEYFASRGLVAIAADYRVQSRHGTGVTAAIEDGRDAVRWVRVHAERLGVDPQRVIGAGGSAGGMIAACLGILPDLDPHAAMSSVSYVPNALVLFNPGLLTPLASDGENVVTADANERPTLVPHMRDGLPPCLLLFGTEDRLLEIARKFQNASLQCNNRCELKTWDGMGHAFFNYGRHANVPFVETVFEADKFLASLGYLHGAPTIRLTADGRVSFGD